MKNRLYAFLLVFMAFAARALAQAPVVTAPANGAINVAYANPTLTLSSNSTGNDPGDPETMYFEISDASDFAGDYYWSSNDIVREDDVPDSYNTTGPTLNSGTTYYIRAYSDKNGLSSVNTFTTASVPVTGTNRLSLVHGVAPNTTAGAVTVWPNRRSFSMDLNQTIPNATEYVIQWDTTGTFTNVIDSLVVSGTTAHIRVDIGGLAAKKLSGQIVYVRTHGRNSSSYGPFGNVRRFGWPMQPTRLEAPTGIINRYSFKLWTKAVTKGTRYYFQVDDSPNFSSPHVLTGQFAALNKTVSGITGNVFENNYTAGGDGRAFDYLTQLTNTTYYVRVRAWNSNQVGYWADTFSVAPLPVLTSGFAYLNNNQTSVPVSWNFRFYDDPNYTETSWDFQVSRQSNFSTLDVNVTGLTNRYYYVPNLRYNTQYYVRVRSFVGASPSSYVTYTITTQALPNLFITAPAPGQTWPNIFVHGYSNWEGSVDTYEWNIEKTNAPAAGPWTVTSSTYGRNFPSVVARGGSYRIRVRGLSTVQGVTGNWSAWVNFSVAAPGPLVPPAASAASREGVDEVVAEPVAFPNPFTGRFTLALPEGATAYSVTDLNGRIVERSANTLPVQEVGQAWPGGIYLITVSTPAGEKRLRVVKQ